MIDLSGQERERYLSSLLDRDWSRSPTRKFSLTVDRRLTRRNGRSRTPVYERSRRRRNGERGNSARPRREKRSSSRCLCKDNEETCESKASSFESAITTSLFGLLVVTLTTCCQAILLGTMSQNNGKAVGLSPGVPTPTASPFNDPMGSAGSFHCVIPMPSSGTPGAPHFDGLNVTDFLDRFSDLCDEHGVSSQHKFTKLPRYCDKLIGDFIKSTTAWAEGEWYEMVEELKKEYRDGDSDQKINSRAFLESLKSVPRAESD
jgi:hypothetical protein